MNYVYGYVFMQFIVVRVEWGIRFLHTIILASMKFSIVFTEWKILFNPPDLLIVHMYIANVNFVLELKACSIVNVSFITFELALCYVCPLDNNLDSIPVGLLLVNGNGNVSEFQFLMNESSASLFRGQSTVLPLIATYTHQTLTWVGSGRKEGDVIRAQLSGQIRYLSTQYLNSSMGNEF